MAQLTAKTITFDQIKALRSEAAQAADYDQVAICDLALDGEIDTDDYTCLSDSGVERLRSMGRDEAYQACADAINTARASEVQS